jgi:TetR/AcrR family transcriptional regulator, tetracycline repressor protein
VTGTRSPTSEDTAGSAGSAASVATTASTDVAAAPRRRGRPPRVSREQLVDAAIAVMRDEPDEPLTIARVAEQAGVSPMALYRHFRDRDELVDEVVGRLLTDRNAAIPHDAPWQEQLRTWVLGALEHLVPCSQVVSIVLAGGTTQWLHDAATLARILERAGCDDEQVAELQVWIALSVSGYVMAEASRRKGPTAAETYAALAQLPPEDAQRLERLMPYLDHAFDHLHDRFADRLIASVAAEVAK